MAAGAGLCAAGDPALNVLEKRRFILADPAARKQPAYVHNQRQSEGTPECRDEREPGNTGGSRPKIQNDIRSRDRPGADLNIPAFGKKTSSVERLEHAWGGSGVSSKLLQQSTIHDGPHFTPILHLPGRS